MTPKEKAKELIEKFSATYIIQPNGIVSTISANPKKCAIICVKEILDVFGYPTYFHETRAYWQSVLKELE